MRVCCDKDVVRSRDAAKILRQRAGKFAVAADATVIGGGKPRFAIFRKLFFAAERISLGRVTAATDGRSPLRCAREEECRIRSNLYLAKWLLLLPAAVRLLVPPGGHGRVSLQAAKISARNYRKMKALEAAKERERHRNDDRRCRPRCRRRSRLLMPRNER